jgi:biotin operon repressor
MGITEQSQELLEFFKALADANRLKIIGLLAQQEYSGEDLAAMLDIKPTTISHHLAYLVKVGLVSARPESYYNYYRLEEKALEEKSRRLLSRESLQAAVDDIDLDAYDKKVVKNYMTPDGRFKSVPLQQKKLLAVLRFLAESFEFDRRYAEKEVNEIIKRYHEDTAGLRRDLIDFKLMAREAGVYWRIAQPSAN